MAARLTEEQLRAINENYRAEVPSLKTARALGLDHRTVKRWYKKGNDGDLLIAPNTVFQRMFLEATRLLAWPSRKLLEVLWKYKTLLEGDSAKNGDTEKIEQHCTKQGAAKIKLPKPIEMDAPVKSLIRYLQRTILPEHANPSPFQTTSRWEKGTAAVHVVQIEWMQHAPEKTWLLKTPEGKLTTGWLLLLADRHCGQLSKRDKWKLKVRFAILPGRTLDKAAATETIVDYLNSAKSRIRTLHLVCGEDGDPTATVPAAELQALLPAGIVVVPDVPTKGVQRPFQLQWSFPSPRSVENYLDVLLAYPNRQFPASEDDFWRNLRKIAAKEDFRNKNILSRRKT